MLIRSLFTLCAMMLCIGAAPASADQLTPEKKAAINRLLDMTGAMAMGVQMSDFMVSQIISQISKTEAGSPPPKVIATIKSEAHATFVDNLPALRKTVVEVYAQHLSLEDVNALIAFYGTEIGRKSIRVMPLIVQDCQRAGQHWGESLQPILRARLIKRFKKEGLDASE